MKQKKMNVEVCRLCKASLVSGVQGLDPRRNFQAFIRLVRVQKCISGILRIQIIQNACPNKVRVLVLGKYENNIWCLLVML